MRSMLLCPTIGRRTLIVCRCWTEVSLMFFFMQRGNKTNTKRSVLPPLLKESIASLLFCFCLLLAIQIAVSFLGWVCGEESNRNGNVDSFYQRFVVAASRCKDAFHLRWCLLGPTMRWVWSCVTVWRGWGPRKTIALRINGAVMRDVLDNFKVMATGPKCFEICHNFEGLDIRILSMSVLDRKQATSNCVKLT